LLHLYAHLERFQLKKNKINDFLKFKSDREKFIKLGGEISHRYPIWSDYRKQAGSSGGDYFHQDLLVASFIHENRPQKHIDVGSRIDGFVAHVAAFRKIQVLDIRPLSPLGHANIEFIQADLMKADNRLPKADSVSCLHAIEHFGLGRYGDPIDPLGHQKGFSNLVSMLEDGGTLYMSFPIGRQNEVHFNAHRVFHPRDILSWQASKGLYLVRFDYVDDAGNLHQKIDLASKEIDVNLGCGIYTFKKL
jgi:hypothetical protein